MFILTSFWSVKHLNFAQKLPIRTLRHTFLESRHHQVTKNLYYYVLSPEGSRKKVSAHGLKSLLGARKGREHLDNFLHFQEYSVNLFRDFPDRPIT